LVGDGSGSTADRPLGWACVAIEPGKLMPEVYYGCANAGTVNNAELLAYLLPLTAYAARTKIGIGLKQIHIVTDSQFTANVGSGRESKSTPILFTAYQCLARSGFQIHWHWMRREELKLNQFVDNLSRKARLLIQNQKLE